VTRPDLTPFITGTGSLSLAIVNEYDPIPRADNDYIRSLLDLHRSAYGLPKITNEGDSQQKEEAKDEAAPAPVPYWTLPPPTFYNLGQLVVLRDANSDQDQLDLRAESVTPEEFSKLLFCKVAVHSRRIYLENVENLKGGMFNGKTSW
jgi:hypothetical protein